MGGCVTTFISLVLFVAIVLYLPGLFAASFFFRDGIVAIAVAPLLSFALLAVIGVFFHSVDISSEWWMLVISAVALSFIVFLFRNVATGPKEVSIASGIDWRTVIPYVLLGMLITGIFFVGSLAGFSSFAQLFDNASHLNSIKAMANGGNYSILAFDSFTGEELGSGISPSGASTHFYPAAWHLVTALACAAFGVSAAFAENASLFVMVGVVFPVSMWLLLVKVFEGNRKLILCGSVCALAFSAFPWYFLVFGPLYSNLAAFAVVPIAIFITITVVESCCLGHVGIRDGLIVLAMGASLASLQPNAVFSVVVLSAPFCIGTIMKLLAERGISIKRRTVVSIAAIGLVLIVWVLLWMAPPLSATVTYPWPAIEGKCQAVIDVATLALRSNVPQLVLGLLVFAGAIYCIVKKNNRALVVSYGICALMFFICVTSDGTVRSLVDGFWYNDAYRIAALVALAGIPLSAIGLYVVCNSLGKLFRLIRKEGFDESVPFLAVLLLAIALLYSTGGVFSQKIGYYTPFGDIQNRLDWLGSSDTRRYAVDEEEFVCRALDLIGDDNKGVLNIPYDGSVFAYGADGMETVYRGYFSYGGDSEKPESILLRTSLVDIAYDDDVKEAARLMNVGYVLKLDSGGLGAEESTLDDDQAVYAESEFQGINSINDDTPGFDLVLSEGDMRFYRIVF